MKNGLNVDVLISGLSDDVTSSGRLLALRTMLRFAKPVGRASLDAEAWLCGRFGIARQRDWPAGPYAALGDGLDAATGHWFCLAPLHLQLQRDSFAAMSQPRWMNATQAALLIQTLNAHFAEDGMRFHAPRPDRWYLQLNAATGIETVPLAQVLGRDVASRLPSGPDALHWHRWMNEVQMLLHDHPVNLELEAAGLPPVNSLWLWGGGSLQQAIKAKGIGVLSDQPLVIGLSRASGTEAMPLPASADVWLKAGGGGDPQLLVLDQLAQAGAQDRDVTMDSLDSAWLLPLLQAVRDRRADLLGLHLASAGAVSSYRLRTGDTWKFWRRARAMGDYLG